MTIDFLTPPDHPALTWRPLSPDDAPALAALEAAGVSADGGLPLASEADFVRGRYTLDAAEGQAASLGAVRADGTLAAATAVRRRTEDGECRALIAGLVHPDARRQGLGDFLIRWALAQANSLVAACPASGERAITVSTESRNPAADALYARYALRETHAEYVMRRDLDQPLPAAPFPPDVVQASWSPERAGLFFEAYDAAFRERPGFPGWTADEWIEWISGDHETFSAERSRVVLAAGQPVAFMINSAEWVAQIGVPPEWRGHGIAQALLVQLMRELQSSGAQATWLTVAENYPRASHVYQQLGYVIAGGRVRYTRYERAGT